MTDVWDSAEIARAYADVRTGLRGAEHALWADALRAAVPDMVVRRALDVGCGTGRFTALLAEVFGGTVVGLDGSPSMLSERPVGGALAFVNAEAAALPVRSASLDLALLSMVYHLLTPPGPAVAELRRALRADGRVVVRTPTREHLDCVPFLPFFPEARAIDEARIPPRAALLATFEAGGFLPERQTTIEQEFARSPAEAYEKVRRRPFSVLRLIPDAAFVAGLARYEAHCRSAPPTALREPLDLFVFRRL